MMGTVFFLATCCIFFYSNFIKWNEGRDELVIIRDPFHWLDTRLDFSWQCTLLLYLCGINFFLHYYQWDLVQACISIITLVLMRCLILYLLPLRGNPDMVPLRDPIIDTVLGASSKPMLNDCSLSGHVSMLLLLAWIHPQDEWYYNMAAYLTAFMLIVSKVHYTIDCVLAWPVAYYAFHYPLASLVAHPVLWGVLLIWFANLFIYCREKREYARRG